MLSGVSHVHHQGAQVTDKNLIKPEHPGWCDSTGWTWGRSCLCPKPEPVPSSLCHRAEPGSPAQQSRSRAGPGCSDKTFSLLPLLPPTTSPAPDCSFLEKSRSRRWLCPVSLWDVSAEEDVCVRLPLCLNSLQRTV